MAAKRFEHTYYNSYYYSNIIDNILSGDADLLGFINSFFDNYDYYFIKPFEKVSAFHMFIHSTLFDFFMNDMNEYDEKTFNRYTKSRLNIPTLYAETVFKEYDIDYSFSEFIGSKNDITYEDIEQYHNELILTDYLELCIDKITEEVFYLLFNNRNLLTRFNVFVSYRVLNIVHEDHR
jgi:hypothetical protein